MSLVKNMSTLATLNIDIALQTFASHGAFGNILIGATKAPIRCGFASGKMTNRLTHLVPVVHDKHHISLNLDLLRRLGHYDVVDPAGRVLPAVETKSQAFPPGYVRETYGRYAVISAGSDPKMRFKRWDTYKWANLCDRLAADGIKPVFVGHISEKEEIEGILSQSDGDGVNLAGSTGLADLAALLQDCSVVIGTDGMLLHLAAAMAKPCVGIFGPTHADNVGPWRQSKRVVTLSLPCSPCYGLDTTGKSISCTTHECLKHLPVEMVYQKVRSTIEETEREVAAAGEEVLPRLA
jgi:ADP-heptose:LPS heptosyltransferase